MARQARKAKIGKISNAAATIADTKIYGDEPSFAQGHVLSTTEEMATFNWYSYMQGSSEARSYLFDYLTGCGRVQEAQALMKLPDWSVPLTAAWIIRIESNGGRFKTAKTTYVNDKILECLRAHIEPDNDDEPAPVVNVQKRIVNKAGDFIASIEAVIDSRDESFSLYSFFTENGISGRVAKQILDYYEPLAEELDSAVDGDDGDLVEAYSCYKKSELKAYAALVNRLVEDAAKFTDNVRKQRKPRKTKIKTPDKVLQFFKPKPKDDEHKLVSVNSTGILGAQEAWLFNTRYKTLTVLRASDSMKGLGVHRTAITGYDEKTSITKRIGRRADTILETLLNGGKVARRKLLENVKTDAIDTKDRVNDDVMLLLVSK